MSWQVTLTRPAQHDLRRLDRQVAARIIAAITRLADTEHGDVRRLRGNPPQWRLRVGDWRVICLFDTATNTLEVQRILPRGRAYR